MDKPIIFSGPMVRALLEGRKTQTRRLIKPQPYTVEGVVFTWEGPKSAFLCGPQAVVPNLRDHGAIRFAPGDRLYVREAHALVPSSAYRMSPGVPYAVNDEDGSQACVYREGWERSQPGTGWRPSIHMPRWASRLTLTVTEVRVQRLQEITWDDAVAEGCAGVLGPDPDFPDEWDAAPDEQFRDLWNSLHGPVAWDANPWVVAVSFTVEQRNIDA